MSEFLVEFYLSRTDAAARGRSVRRARLAAEKQTRQGTPVRYLRSMYLPDEETCFLLYEAESAEAIRAILARDPWSETHLRIESIDAWTIRLDGRRS